MYTISEHTSDNSSLDNAIPYPKGFKNFESALQFCKEDMIGRLVGCYNEDPTIDDLDVKIEKNDWIDYIKEVTIIVNDSEYFYLIAHITVG